MMMNKAKIINIFGNPGSGKSTIAAYLFSEMKARGLEVELVTETAKDLVWDNDYTRLENQILVFGMQLHRLNTLCSKVDYVITDSPLLLQLGYYRQRNLPAPAEFEKLVMDYNNQFINTNILLKDNDNISQIGRAEIDLKPMDYIKDLTWFDLKIDCTKRQEILDFVLNNAVNKI